MLTLYLHAIYMAIDTYMHNTDLYPLLEFKWGVMCGDALPMGSKTELKIEFFFNCSSWLLKPFDAHTEDKN